jgi:uncharacterized protein involved in exopolysaccharide biosynthesis
MNRQAIEYGVLQREVESSRQIYDSLLQRAKETGISSEAAHQQRARRSIWRRRRAPPSARGARINLLLALLGGSFLGCCLAFLLEYVDNRIKSPDELKQHLGCRRSGSSQASRRRCCRTVHRR